MRGVHMKKWVILAVATMMGIGVQAQEKGPVTKDQFMAAQEQTAKTNGTAFDKAKAEAAFTAKDKNGDGVLTADEMTPAGKSKKGGKGPKKAEGAE